MPKSKIKETHSLKVEGILDINADKTISIDVEEVGLKDLSDLLIKFNGEDIKLTISLCNDID
jgi:hypothetical protein